MKMALQEKNFGGESPTKSSSPESEKLVNLLEEKISEKEQIITRLQNLLAEEKNRGEETSKSAGTFEQSTMDLKKEIELLKDDWGLREKELMDQINSLLKELNDSKEKYETELSEKDILLKEKDAGIANKEGIISALQLELQNKDSQSKDVSNERLLLLDTEKERQFLDEKRSFKESVKELQEELDRVVAERNQLREGLKSSRKGGGDELNRIKNENKQLTKELETARRDVELKNKEAKEATAKMLKSKGQLKSKLANIEKENAKISKELEALRKKKPGSSESSKLREQIADLEEEKGNLQLKLVEFEEMKTSLQAREKNLNDLKERCALLEEEKKSLTLKVVDAEEEKGLVQLQNVEYEDKFSKDEKQFSSAQNEKIEQLTSERDRLKEALDKANEEIREKTKATEDLTKAVNEQSAKETMFDKEKSFFEQTYNELKETNENLKANLAEVEGYLLREREEKVSFQIKMAQVEEEKESLEDKKTELQQALDDFIWTTDKGKGAGRVEEGPQEEGWY